MKRGFTLVELSIVLVIIGLLIGGILVGQSLIESAKVNNFTSQLTQYEAAIALFEDKYKNLPGDSPAFPVPGGGSDANDFVPGDGQIDQEDISVTLGNLYFTGEISYFWKNLSDSNMLQADYSEDGSAGVKAGVHFPEMTYEGAGIFAGYGRAIGRFNGINTFLIGAFDSTTDELLFPSDLLDAIPLQAAMSIETKLDDGDPKAGNIDLIDGTGCVVSGEYDIANSGKCALFITLGATL